MNVRFVGLGKLGAPIAQELTRTHTVFGYDIDPSRREAAPSVIWAPPQPEFAQPVVDLVLVAVPTPHGPEYEGITRLPETRADFDYTHLVDAVTALAAHPERPPLVIVSTVLPGTIEREILPLWLNADGSQAPVLYSPQFIAMGTVVEDFLDPEFVLVGAQDPAGPAADVLTLLYRSVGVDAPVFTVGYREAELTKMAYNTWISAKIALANNLGEIAHRMSIDADAVTGILKHATRRIVSTAYMDPGMGDGGACHPRDCIALSWLAREQGMSYDLFGALMEQREAHTDWLASLIEGAAPAESCPRCGKAFGDPDGCMAECAPVTILGKAYKPGTDLTVGSPALLLASLLEERCVQFNHRDDPV